MKNYLKQTLLLANKESELLEGAIISPKPREYNGKGHAVYEEKKSFSYDLESDKFHDFANVNFSGHSLTQYCSKLEQIKQPEAKKLIELFDTNWEDLETTEISYPGFTDKVINEFQLGKRNGSTWSIPIYYYNQLVDIRSYYAGGNPKVISLKNAVTGLIVGFEKFINSNDKLFIICEGEKDMLIAQSKGLNAYAITGGALAIPKYQKRWLKNKNYFLIYDNDNAGEAGAKRMASFLYQNGAKSVKINTNICSTSILGNDLYDFFMVYNKKTKDLIEIYNNLPKTPITTNDKLENKQAVPLAEIFEQKNIRTYEDFTTKIQVLQVKSDFFTYPTNLNIIEILDDGVFEKVETIFIPKTDFIYFNRNEVGINNWLKTKYQLKGNYQFEYRNEIVVYNYIVGDFKNTQKSYTAYSFVELEAAKNYKVDFKIIREPDNKSKTAILILKKEEIDAEFRRFISTGEKQEHLKSFQNKGSIKEIMNQNYENFLSYLGSYVDPLIYFFTELTFSSVWKFKFRQAEAYGYIDWLLVGDTRIGKSATYKALQKLYSFGSFINLRSITSTALIGGSVKSGDGKNYTTVGELTKNHQGIIALEELQGALFNVQPTITDIRSRKVIKIDRVGSSITVPTALRMITMANPKDRSVRNHSKGVDIIKGLDIRAEDIARYDIISIVSALDINKEPLEKKETPEFDKNYYETKIRWITSRNPDDIEIAPEVENYIWTQTEKLNNLFKVDDQYIGREGYLKISRLTIALASFLISTDEKFKKVIVLKEHVKWVCELVEKNYKSKDFKLDETAIDEKKRRELNDEDLAFLKQIKEDKNQERYNTLILIVENSGRFTKKELIDQCDMIGADSFNIFYKELFKRRLINVWGRDKIFVSLKLTKWDYKNESMS